jgi:hypothetical protein
MTVKAKLNRKVQQHIEQYRSALEHSAIQYNVSADISNMKEGDCLIIDGNVSEKKWNSLEKITKQHIVIENKDRKLSAILPQSLNSMYEEYLGTKVKEDSEITVIYHGNISGGYCRFSGELPEGTAKDQEYLDKLGLSPESGIFNSPLYALKFDLTLDGILEAFYTAFELPKAGAWWHGRMGKDYNLIFNIDELIIPLLDHGNIFPGSPDMRTINFYTGIMVKKCKKGYALSCLASYPHHKLADFSINVFDGVAQDKLESAILEPTTTYRY